MDVIRMATKLAIASDRNAAFTTDLQCTRKGFKAAKTVAQESRNSVFSIHGVVINIIYEIHDAVRNVVSDSRLPVSFIHNHISLWPHQCRIQYWIYSSSNDSWRSCHWSGRSSFLTLTEIRHVGNEKGSVMIERFVRQFFLWLWCSNWTIGREHFVIPTLMRWGPLRFHWPFCLLFLLCWLLLSTNITRSYTKRTDQYKIQLQTTLHPRRLESSMFVVNFATLFSSLTLPFVCPLIGYVLWHSFHFCFSYLSYFNDIFTVSHHIFPVVQ